MTRNIMTTSAGLASSCMCLLVLMSLRGACRGGRCLSKPEIPETWAVGGDHQVPEELRKEAVSCSVFLELFLMQLSPLH